MVDERHGSLQIELVHPSRQVDIVSLEDLLRLVVSEEGCVLNDLTVVLTGHEQVLSLNSSYLRHDFITDVLSFDLSEGPGAIDGEVYVDLDTAAERHEEFGATFDDEVFRYAVHGVLHLAGHTDDTPAGKDRMHALEDRYLALRRSRA